MKAPVSRFPGPRVRALVLVLAAFSQASCGGGGGGGSRSTAPSISNLVFGPSAVYVDSGGGTETVYGTFSFSDPDGDVASARIVTLDGTGRVVADVTEPIVGLSGQKSGEVEGEVTVGTTVADTYTIRLSVIDGKGLRSNELTSSFRVSDFPWVAKQPMPVPREEFATAVVAGRIYVMGGYDPTYPGWPKPPTRRVDVYDPATDTWTVAPEMPVALIGHAAAAVGGRIYVAGGQTDLWPAVNALHVYDPLTLQWSEMAPMPVSVREAAAAAAVGRLWVFGGERIDGPPVDALSYDPGSNAWRTHAPMLYGGSEMSAATVADRILVIGGYGGMGHLQVVQQYDPTTDAWAERSDLPWPPRSEAGVAVVDARVYVAGGHNWDPGLESVLAHDMAADAWSGKTAMPMELNAPRAEAVNGRIYVIEGGVTLEYTPANEIL